MQRKRMTAIQQFKVSRRLEEVLFRHGDGLVTYRKPHSDASVAAEMEVSKFSVAHLRTNIFGRLRAEASPVSLQDRIVELERRVATIEKNLTP